MDDSQSTRFEPIKPYTDEQMCFTLNRSNPEPVVDQDTRAISVKEVQRLVTMTDHRFADGSNLSKIRNVTLTYYADPESFKPDDYKDYPTKKELSKEKKAN